MTIKSNVSKPEEICVFMDDNTKFFIGDNVRIQYVDWKGGIIGKISDIFADSLAIYTSIIGERIVSFSEIQKMKKVALDETFDTVPFYDEEEVEFWRTHWVTREGIKEKTAEDIRMLEEFKKKYMQK